MAEISSDRKAERLINLTMALLATPRFMTKSEIFANISGYEGDEEAKSRKFERDKDDLRALGIIIEVGSNDPYFEDEQGYKISRDSYSLALLDVSSEEYSLISIAISMWRNEFFSQNGQSALRKIQSLDLEVGEPLLPKNLFAEEVPHHYFDEIWQAIANRRTIEFNYHSSTTRLRRVAPYSLTLWHSFWYLTGLDLEAQEIRTFKVLRMLDGLSLSRTDNSFEVPADFSAKEYLKFQEESESVEATSIEEFESKLTTLKDTYFAEGFDNSTLLSSLNESAVFTGHEGSFDDDGSTVSAYAQFLSKTSKK